MVVFAFAYWLEQAALSRVRRSLATAVADAEADANIACRVDGSRVDIAELKVGDVVVIRSGERVPVDGRVVKGKGAVDESAVTGEPVAVTKKKGDEVSANTIAASGYLEVEVTKRADESSTATLRRMVEEAQASESRTQQIVSRFARRRPRRPRLLRSEVAATPRPRRGSSFDESRRRRGCDVDGTASNAGTSCPPRCSRLSSSS